MKRSCIALPLLAAAAWLVLSQSAAAADSPWPYQYPAATKLYSASVHKAAGMKCADCHAGDPKAPGTTALDKRVIAELCARCHSDVRKMNPYGLPTDQLERYKTSKHGEQLFTKNDQKVAVCIDCHGVHDILKVKSPQSRTYPTNVPATCGRCHSDEKLMSQYKLTADVVAKYKTSYHAKLLLEKGDLSVPTCVTCHGNHGATPPGTAEVGQVCGKCHQRQRELFEKSPHAEAAGAGLFNECISCHGNHAIQKASVELFKTACIQCHEKDPKQLRRRDAVTGLIRTAQDDYDRASAQVKAATVRGFATDDDQLLLQEAKTEITQLQALQHTLALDQLKPVAQRADELLQQTRSDIAGMEKFEQWKRRALVPVWIFLGGMAVLFWKKRKQLES